MIENNFNKYNELHLHTTHTLGNSILTINDAVLKAEEYRMTALGIMDSGTINGVDEFVSSCSNASIKPIIGCGFYLTLDNYRKNSIEKYHLPIIAKNSVGLSNLKELDDISHSITSLTRPQIDINLLKKYSKGLIVFTGGRGGPVDKLINAGQREEAVALLLSLKNIFINDIYIEIQDNGRIGESYANSNLSLLSTELEVEMVATGGPFYLNSNDAQLCNNLRNDNGNAPLFGDGFVFQSPSEQIKKFKNYKNATQNTVIISNSINYKS